METQSQYYESAAKVFYQDSYEKKRIARGIHNRASRRSGLRGPVMFQSDYLSGKAKEEYQKGSEIVTTNLYEDFSNLVSFEELKKLPKEEQFAIVAPWFDHHDSATLADAWQVPKQTVYQLRYDYTKFINNGGTLKKAEVKRSVNTIMAETKLMSREEFLALSKPERKETLSKYMDLYPTAIELAQAWGVPKQFVYDNSRALGINKGRVNPGQSNSVVSRQANRLAKQKEMLGSPIPAPAPAPAPAPQPEISVFNRHKGFKAEDGGQKIAGNLISDTLTDMAGFLEKKTDRKFNYYLLVVEDLGEDKE